MNTAGPLGALALASLLLALTSLLLAAGAAAQPTSVSTSVSEASARARMESRGFRDIGVLSETSAGVWNGTVTPRRGSAELVELTDAELAAARGATFVPRAR